MTNFKYLWLLFMPGYILSFILALSSNSMFSCWVGLEVNLLMVISLLKLISSSTAEIQTMKYFLPQSLGSVFLLMGICMVFGGADGGNVFSVFWLFGLFAKLGLFPFYSWFISLFSNLNMTFVWIFSVPQKLIPFWLLMSSMCESFSLVYMAMVLGVIFSTVNILRQGRILLVLGYSSLFNLSWMIFCVRDKSSFSHIFLLYGVSISVLTFSFVSSKKTVSVNSMNLPWNKFMSVLLAFLNLGGMPPFLNMWSKAFFLQMFFFFSAWELLVLFIISSLAILYSYLSMSFNYIFFMKSRMSALNSHKEMSFSWCLLILSMVFFFF